jgi:AcrR family transcriptional regulator
MTDIRPKHDRRAQLLAAARVILAEKGLEATTIAEIVARAGVAQGTFYLYFPSKVALAVALNQEMNENILQAVRAATTKATTAAGVVEAGVSAVFQQLEQYRDVLSIVRSQTILERAGSELDQGLEAYHSLIAELIQQRQGTGEVDPTVNPGVAARLIAGLINHAADESYLYDLQTPREIYITEVIRFVQRALGIS